MINNDGYFWTTIEAEASMFFIKYETEENINGELPPIIYIKGNRNKFHNALLTLLKKLRMKVFTINIRELGIVIDERVTYVDIILKIQDKTELFYNTETLIIGIEYDNFIDILFELEQLAFTNATVFFEYEWVQSLYNGAIIVESCDSC